MAKWIECVVMTIARTSKVSRLTDIRTRDDAADHIWLIFRDVPNVLTNTIQFF